MRGALGLIEHIVDEPERDRRELYVQNVLASLLTVVRGFADVVAGQAWDRARVLCLKVGDARQSLVALGGLSSFLTAQGEFEASRTLDRHLLELGEALDDTGCLVTAHVGEGVRRFFQGDLHQAAAEFEAVLSLYGDDLLGLADAFPYFDPGVGALALSGVVQCLLGCEIEGGRRLALAVETSHRSDRPLTRGLALFWDSLRYILADDPHAAGRRSAELAVCAAEAGLAEIGIGANFVGGWARARQGAAEEGVDDIRRGCEHQRARGDKAIRTLYLGCLADAYMQAGSVGDALSTLDEALAIGEQTGERFYESELLRARGQLLSAHFPERADEAGGCLRRALSIAVRQGAVTFERRAAEALDRHMGPHDAVSPDGGEIAFS